MPIVRAPRQGSTGMRGPLGGGAHWEERPRRTLWEPRGLSRAEATGCCFVNRASVSSTVKWESSWTLSRRLGCGVNDFVPIKGFAGCLALKTHLVNFLYCFSY